ncbi:MAG: ATP-binding protein [Methylococcaceae bacterium]
MRHFSGINIHEIDTKFDQTELAYQPLLAIWAIQIAICCGWHRKRRPTKLPDIFQEDDFASLTGIIPPVETDEDGDIKNMSASYSKLTNAKLLKLLKGRLSELGKEELPNNLPLFANVEIIGDIVGLSKTEKTLLIFAIALTSFPEFRKVIEARSHSVSTSALARVLAATLNLPKSEIVEALRDDALLSLTGIIQTEKGSRDFERKIEVADRFAEMLLVNAASEADLIKHFLKSADKPTLALSDYPHLASDLQALSAYLSNSLTQKVPGVNVLFYGAPGTGKTELVKALAASLEADLYEVAYTDADGDSVKGDERLKAFNLCQQILVRKPNAMLLFDEVEDVFERQSFFSMMFGGGSNSEKGKAWINRSLEKSSTPAIWVTNDESIDPAYLRRFDYSVRFPIPPQKVRQKIALHHLGQFNPTDDWLAHIASNDQVSPGQLERAAKVARISGAGDFEIAKKLVEQTLDRSVTLLGQKRVPNRNVLRTRYNLDFINTDMPVSKLVDAMKINPSGTFCFYGPAGTGKSELARYMADEIGKPLMLRRASDILSMWVGGSEKNIANMFAEARQQEAVLVLDEADSFLADRRDAKQSWEVTQVNELLTQMEAFEGIFVCTTNLMEKLDQASLRRFAFKLKFDYLNADQRWAMFTQELERLGGDLATAADWEKQVRNLSKLTPGDFAVAARQFAILNTPAVAGDLYRQLLEECKVKGGATGKIGFMG